MGYIEKLKKKKNERQKMKENVSKWLEMFAIFQNGRQKGRRGVVFIFLTSRDYFAIFHF